ncbi:hypothetical protein GP486_002797 [Trichoglossum hirsutum]|uniref:JmjC domain-containing histone demethylation protein 1 n=1 Tax=Trichoglossum hirsutum TaxID=265104 RepID=A0A9P8RRC2_9PEZI|nr:hypothetical protein GP486_002797 [Trichoglossum hirsutum]
MAKSTSTRFKDLRGRPLDYRTPSPPPRSAIEDIPPLTPPTQGIFNTSFIRTKLNGRAKRGVDDSYKGMNYRTPSPPPRSAIEAISPLTPVRSTADAITSETKTKDRRITQSAKGRQNGHDGREELERRSVRDRSRWNSRGGDETEGEDEPYSMSKDDGGALAVANSFGVDYHTSSRSTHQFSSAMDAIATIAMATSPTFGPQSHQLPSAFLQSHYHSQYPTSQFLQPSQQHSSPAQAWSEERPAKRVRSDNPSEVSAQENQRLQISYNSPVWNQSYTQQTAWNSGPGPTTPQRRQTNVTNSDAELLLNVGRVAVFGRPPAPRLMRQPEPNENGRLDMAYVGQLGNAAANRAETNSSFRNVNKYAESGSAIHHRSGTVNASGANSVLHAVIGNEARGPNGAAAPSTAQNTSIKSREEQNTPNRPISKDPLEIDRANSTTGSLWTIADRLPANDGLASDLSREQPGWRPQWPSRVFDAEKKHLETSPRNQGATQKSRSNQNSSPTPVANDQLALQESSPRQVKVNGNNSELVEVSPKLERRNAVPMPLILDDCTINGAETNKVEAMPLPRESGVLGDGGNPLAELAPLRPENSVMDDVRKTPLPLAQEHGLVDDVEMASTETTFLPPGHHVKDDVRRPSADAASSPQERDTINDVRMTPTKAASSPQEQDKIVSTETTSAGAVTLPQENDIEIASAKALPLSEEHDTMDIVETTSSGAVPWGRGATFTAEGTTSGALPLPQEHRIGNGGESAIDEAHSGGVEQKGSVDMIAEGHVRDEMSQKPTRDSEPDREVAARLVSSTEGGIALETRVEANHGGLVDGSQGFIQELREYVKRSTGESVGAQGTKSPAAGATPAPGPPECGDVTVGGQVDVAESASQQAAPANASHMVRGESQSSESRGSGKQVRRGWPKGKPRGPRSSWPGVIKAKEGVRLDDKPGSSGRANRSAGRKENQNEGPIGSQHSAQMKSQAAITKPGSTEDAQRETPGADPRRRAEDPNDIDSNVSADTRSHDVPAEYPRSPSKDMLFPSSKAFTETLSRDGSLPPLRQHIQENINPPIPASFQVPAVALLNNARASPQTAVTMSPPGAPDSDDVQRPLTSTSVPTLDQTPVYQQSLHHRSSVPDEPTDGPKVIASKGENREVEYGDVPTLAKALSAPSEHGQDFIDRNSDAKGKAPGREDANTEAEQSVCAGCSMLPNSLGGDSYLETISWIKCDGCKRWFHYACAGFTEKEVKSVDKFSCPTCWDKCGPTTFVRKSSRAHTSIDYAGLHEGVVKTSEESLDHPYVKPIKDGTIKFLPESFLRMTPEVATREYFERFGMKEPVVIPGCLNPRPDNAPDVDKLCCDHSESESQVFIKQTIDYWLAGDFDKLHGPNHGQDAMDMVIPRNLTVKKVAQLYGPGEKVEVINVKSQGEDGPWNMKKWADYYESSDKQFIRNVISLEISTSELGRLVKRPKVVRDMDLADSVWPAELRAKGDFPKVQLYCLMSVENSFTDFHIDFGGSSVFYHILKGKKTFLFIPPKPKHLKKYEQWCLSPAQNQTFLPDQTKECIRVDLSAGDTMLIPSGWIHAVWTPEDSLVIGGNFLTRFHYGMQISIAEIEKNTKVPRKFRYPSFQRVLWFTAIHYLKTDPVPSSLVEKLNRGECYNREVPLYQESKNSGIITAGDPETYNARHYPQSELDGLPSLVGYLLRSALISIGKITDGITVDTKQRVTRSIPKGYGDPMEIVKRFAMWSAWKRGNEVIPHWAYQDAIPGDGVAGVGEKKLSAAAIKRLEREAAAQETAPGRQSMRKRAQAEAATVNGTKPTTPDLVSSVGLPLTTTAKKPQTKVASEKRARAATASGLRLGDIDGTSGVTKPVKTPKTSVLGPKRVACDECRKRRVRCKHKDMLEPDEPEVERNPAAGITTPKSEMPRDVAHTTQSLPNTKPPNQGSTNSDSQQTQPPITLGPPAVTLNPHQQLPTSTASTTPAPSGSSGKHRACEKCRKNRRRCIHDGNGNVDPIKAQEPPMPRAISASKRLRPPTIATVDTGRYFKKTKIETDIANSFGNTSESLKDAIRVRPTVPDPLRSFNISTQYAPQRQRLPSEGASRRALDMEQFPRMAMALPSTWGHPQRQNKALQQLPAIPAVSGDASERQLLREEAHRIDKVSGENVVQITNRNGTAAPSPTKEPRAIAPTSFPDDRPNTSTSTDLLDTVQLISTSPVASATNTASLVKSNPDNAINRPNNASPLKLNQNMTQSEPQQMAERSVNNSTPAQEKAPHGIRSEHEQTTSGRTKTERIRPDHGEIGTNGIEAERRGMGTSQVNSGHKTETGQIELEHREIGIHVGPTDGGMETGHASPERGKAETMQTRTEDTNPEARQVRYEHRTETRQAGPEEREAKTSNIPRHQEIEMDQTKPGPEGVEERETEIEHKDTELAGLHQVVPELANEQAKTNPTAANRIEQNNSQSNDGATDYAKRVERERDYSGRIDSELVDLRRAEVERSSSEKIDFELDSSIDDLSSPPDSPLSELDISSPEPEPESKLDPGTEMEPQTKLNPPVKEITLKSSTPPQEHRRRSKRETKEVQRFSAVSTVESHNKHRPNGREASRTPAPQGYKNLPPNLEFPSPGKTYARKSGRPVITPCKTAPLSRPGSIFAAGDDASLAVQGAGKGGGVFSEGENAAEDDEKVSEVDEESWRLAKEMEFGLRRKGLK